MVWTTYVLLNQLKLVTSIQVELTCKQKTKPQKDASQPAHGVVVWDIKVKTNVVGTCRNL